MAISGKRKESKKNIPCPCGSGLKYKKCCGSKLARSSPLWQLRKLEREFSKYDSFELISALGGLQVCPENHSQLIRLETASRIACKTMGGNKKDIDPIHLSNILKTCLPSLGPVGMLEDPIEGLFTSNNIFFGGNYAVYDGLCHVDSFIVQNLLKIIFHDSKTLPEHFADFVFAAATCLLSLSDELTKRNNQFRYMESPDRWREDILVPDIKELRKLSNSVVFSKKEVEKIISIDYEFIEPFIIPIGHEVLNNDDFIKNPLVMRPFVEIDDKLVVASPGSLMGALIHFIWVQSHHFKATEILLEKIKRFFWWNINKNLNMIYFKPIKLELPSWKSKIGEEAVFKIDTDKLAYVLFVMDDLNDFEIDQPYGMWDSTNYNNLINDRCEFISRWLTEGKNPYCKELLVLIVVGQVGRFASFGFKKLPENVYFISMLADELDVVAKTRECDSLSLLKFSKALDKFNFPTGPSFLDQYALYLEHKHSFNLSDEVKPNAIFIDPDYIPHLGKSLRVKVANLWDIHSALYNDKKEYAEVMRLEEFIPIYYNENTHERLVEGYLPPIWIGADEGLLKKMELRPICWDVIGTISYWLWQLTPSLKSHLNKLGFNALNITFNLDNADKWMASDINDLKKVGKNPVFDYQNSDYEFKFIIPFEITSILSKSDNTGDRLIVIELLKALGSLLEHHDLTNELNKIEIERILNLHAPLGIKKHLCIINSSTRTALNPLYLPKGRMLQEFNIEYELNDLVDKLGSKAPPIGKVEEKKAKIKLCGDIVDVYYEQLKSILPKFNWKLLLEKLISNNEAICHKKAYNELNTAPSIGCYLDIQSKVENELIEALDMDRSALTTRALIEIIAAEPPMGNESVSMSDLDELLAITYHIINWAIISDDIHCEIYDIDLYILNSGRIGVDKKSLETIWDPFIRSKTLENVESNLENFKDYYSPKYEPNASLSEDIEDAFLAEFGLTLTQIIEFDSILINFSFEQETSATSLNLLELKDKIIDELKWSDELFDRAIDLFSLRSREKWEVPPPGFYKNDVWPWRYNRRLSYLRRPLIIGPGENPLVFWGPRHIEDAERNLLNLVISGQYIINEKTPKEMKDLIGNVINNLGKKFNNKVKSWFDENSSFEIHQEVPIGPDKELNHEIDLGDIDILAIDRENNQIFSIECKNIFYGRNPREIRNEIERFIGVKEDDNSWIKKHCKRHEWLNNNIDTFSSVYELESDKIQIFSVFLTVREIPTTFIRDIKVPFISFSSLKREGLSILYEILD